MKGYLQTVPAILLISFLMITCRGEERNEAIDRYALVHRHIPQIVTIDSLSPLSAGNGEFAFTVDVTGLQTIPGCYDSGIPLVTQSQWGWHTIPDTIGYRRGQTVTRYDTYGRSVPYEADMNSAPANYFRSNPHRLNLGRIGFVVAGEDVEELLPEDLTGINQQLDLWEGIIKSSFHWKEHPFRVETTVHPGVDQVAVKVESGALKESKLGILFAFPYGSTEWGKSASDWNHPERHHTEVVSKGDHEVTLRRRLDDTRYGVRIAWKGDGVFRELGNHRFLLQIDSGERFGFTCRFINEPDLTFSREKNDPSLSETFKSAREHWERFWQTGGAVDLSGSTHPDAGELERRIVLSQYLTAIQCAGSLPPQETGLTFNSWFGKFHLEMHWWHAAHFALWGRTGLLERSMEWYNSILPAARAKAELQGYRGGRWPKMTAPDGIDSPSGVGVFLIWQQPHPIYYAELIYRQDPGKETLEKYRDLVFETADFMASFTHWDSLNGRYVLGPPLIPAQEIHPAVTTMNPPFELSYWAWGLKTAQQWRLRLGLERNEKWDRVIGHLSSWPSANGYYQNVENVDNTFRDAEQRRDHPSLLGAFGMLPGDKVDTMMMRRTLEQVMKTWNWEQTWGWDFPLTAMTAARVGRPDLAVRALLMEAVKNTYLANGHNYQSERLPVYLPGNGGLLTAIAMMCAGWDGAPDIPAPGFPRDGRWMVRYEGLDPLP
jgi:hypothetical protein